MHRSIPAEKLTLKLNRIAGPASVFVLMLALLPTTFAFGQGEKPTRHDITQIQNIIFLVR